jgi:hypothetical protein
MRILLAQNATFLPGHGGASKSNRLMLEALASRGHACAVLSPGIGLHGPSDRGALDEALRARGVVLAESPYGGEGYRWRGVDVMIRFGPQALIDAIEPACAAFRPDWVLV